MNDKWLNGLSTTVHRPQCFLGWQADGSRQSGFN